MTTTELIDFIEAENKKPARDAFDMGIYSMEILIERLGELGYDVGLDLIYTLWIGNGKREYIYNSHDEQYFYIEMYSTEADYVVITDIKHATSKLDKLIIDNHLDLN